MTPEQTDLSRRLAGLPGFAMMPGMRDNDQTRVLRMIAARTYYADGVREDADPGVPYSGWLEYTHNGSTDDPEAFPDLTDDATGGVLFGWLRALDEDCAVRRSNDDLRVTVHGWPPVAEVDHTDRDDDGRRWWYVTGSTLAEACARALVAMGRCA